MNDRSIRYLAWAALVVAIFAWIGVSMFGWTIMQDESDRATRRESAQQSALRRDVSVRTHALAQDTQGARTHLEDLLNVDVISAVDIIEAAGKAANVNMQLSGAQPEATLSEVPGASLKAVGFTVSGQGSFASLMHALEFFETLPLPSTVERFDLEHTSGSGGSVPSWHLNTDIRVLTTAQISS